MKHVVLAYRRVFCGPWWFDRFTMTAYELAQLSRVFFTKAPSFMMIGMQAP
jgi:hypothetical protein